MLSSPAETSASPVPNSRVSFFRAVFYGGSVSFEGADLSGGDILFDQAEFSGGEVVFDEAEFSDGTMSFEHAEFSGGTVSFEHAKFSGAEVDFSDADDWSHRPKFDWQGTPPAGVKLPATRGGDRPGHVGGTPPRDLPENAENC